MSRFETFVLSASIAVGLIFMVIGVNTVGGWIYSASTKPNTVSLTASSSLDARIASLETRISALEFDDLLRLSSLEARMSTLDGGKERYWVCGKYIDEYSYTLPEYRTGFEHVRPSTIHKVKTIGKVIPEGVCEEISAQIYNAK
jgi:hypothetical protein